MARTKAYVGKSIYGGSKIAFLSESTPTIETHPQFSSVTGPFRTQRAALWFARHYGASFTTIAEAEYAAKLEAEHIDPVKFHANYPIPVSVR